MSQNIRSLQPFVVAVVNNRDHEFASSKDHFIRICFQIFQAPYLKDSFIFKQFYWENMQTKNRKGRQALHVEYSHVICTSQWRSSFRRILDLVPPNKTIVVDENSRYLERSITMLLSTSIPISSSIVSWCNFCIDILRSSRVLRLHKSIATKNSKPGGSQTQAFSPQQRSILIKYKAYPAPKCRNAIDANLQ